MTAWREAAGRLGLRGKEAERSLLFVADDANAVAAAGPMFAELQGRDSRLHPLLCSGDAAIRSTLAGNRWGLRVIAPPYSPAAAAMLYLRQLNTRCVALIGSIDAVRYRSLMMAAEKLAIEVVPVPAADAAATADRLLAIMARDLKPLREGGALSAAFLKLAKSPAVAWRFKQYGTLETLKSRLGSPRTILCLGNGPSSEDSEVSDLGYDVLFRVNHSWLERGILTKPDVVFTGGRPTMRAVKNAIFGLQAPGVEARLAMTRGLNPLIGRTEFFNVNDVTPALKAFDWQHLRPTNGASMLAAAVALAPQHLIVAGIDLFQHPAGSYPGGTQTANAYSPGHTRESELGFVLQLFAQHRGELTIVGEILREEWRRAKGEVIA
jgi:hypothetical protein